MKRLIIILIALSLFGASSCKKYELKGGIEDSDFVGEWVEPFGAVQSTYLIKKNGRTKYSFQDFNNDEKDSYWMRAEQTGEDFKTEYVGMLGERSIRHYKVLTPPTFTNVTYLIKNGTESRNAIGFMVLIFADDTSASPYEYTWYLKE